VPGGHLPPAEAVAALRAAARPDDRIFSGRPDAPDVRYVSCCGNGYDEMPLGRMELDAAVGLVSASGARAWWDVQVGGYAPDATHRFDFGHDLVVMTAGGNVVRFGVRAPSRGSSG
jgi:hypothetical protein